MQPFMFIENFQHLAENIKTTLFLMAETNHQQVIQLEQWPE